MYSNQIEPDRMNIIFGGHLLTAPDQVTSIANACEYVAIQHEVLKSDGVNLSGDAQRLQNVYIPFLRQARVVWEGTKCNLEPLRQLGLRTSFFHGGYHPWLQDVRTKRERDIDFLFYGSVTAHRKKLIQQLSCRGHRVVCLFDPRSPQRNDLIGRTKVHLAPTQGAQMKHFAYGRVGYLLNNRGLVVVERCDDQDWLEHCFITASEDNWLDVCEQTLARGDRDAIREEFADRFQLLPFADQMRSLLSETFEQQEMVRANERATTSTITYDQEYWRRIDSVSSRPGHGPHFTQLMHTADSRQVSNG
jgi:hypothetical protein